MSLWALPVGLILVGAAVALGRVAGRGLRGGWLWIVLIPGAAAWFYGAAVTAEAVLGTLDPAEPTGGPGSGVGAVDMALAAVYFGAMIGGALKHFQAALWIGALAGLGWLVAGAATGWARERKASDG